MPKINFFIQNSHYVFQFAAPLTLLPSVAVVVAVNE